MESMKEQKGLCEWLNQQQRSQVKMTTKKNKEKKEAEKNL